MSGKVELENCSSYFSDSVPFDKAPTALDKIEELLIKFFSSKGMNLKIEAKKKN